MSAGVNNAPSTLDNLINDGLIRPVVVCFLDSVNRAVELNFEGADAYGDAIVRELVPRLRSTYAVSTKGESALLAAVIFGWPAVLASVVLAVTGIATGRARLSLAGAIIACPFLVYVSGAPGLRWVSAISGVLLFSAAVAVARRHRWAAVLLVAPCIGLCGFVAQLVLNQRAG